MPPRNDVHNVTLLRDGHHEVRCKACFFEVVAIDPYAALGKRDGLVRRQADCDCGKSVGWWGSPESPRPGPSRPGGGNPAPKTPERS